MFDTSAEYELESKSGVDVEGMELVTDVLLLVSFALCGVVISDGISDSVRSLDLLPKYPVSLGKTHVPGTKMFKYKYM